MNTSLVEIHRRNALIIACVVLFGLLVVSGLRPYDRATWAMEVAPVVVVLPIFG